MNGQKMNTTLFDYGDRRSVKMMSHQKWKVLESRLYDDINNLDHECIWFQIPLQTEVHFSESPGTLR